MVRRFGPMAVCAMVFLHLSAVLLGGCGAAAYESCAEDIRESCAAESGPGTEWSLSEETSGGERPDRASEGPASPAEKPETIFVHVCGAVRKGGVYELPAGSRVYEAIAAAGGLTREADGTAVNQAAELMGGQQVRVPAIGETAPVPCDPAGLSGGASAAAGDGTEKININTADAAELMKLKGIGASRAEDIITYRENNGPFAAVEDIKKVSGIKEGVFQKIRDSIVTG